jgi:hypothetical protein
MSTGVTERCLQCGKPFGPAAREVTVRSTSDGKLATVHQEYLPQG